MRFKFKSFKRFYLPLFVSLFLLVIPNAHSSVPAAPIELTLKQPSGIIFKAYPKGNIYSHWTETASGHSIIKSKNTWYYAVKDKNGRLRSSQLKVGSMSDIQLKNMPLSLRPTSSLKNLKPLISPQKLPTSINQTKGQVPALLKSFEKKSSLPDINNLNSFKADSAPQAKALAVNQNVLVILVSFSNQTFTHSVSNFNDLIFGASGSVKDYFLENSYNDFTIVAATESDSSNSGAINDGIISVTLGTNHPNSGGTSDDVGFQTSLSDAVTATNASIDFSAYDSNNDGSISAAELSIIFIYAGYERSFNTTTPNIWGHKWNLQNSVTLDGTSLGPYTAFGEQHGSRIATIGIMAHELGHLMLSLPDLYDTDTDPVTGNGDSEGVGNWGLMGAGSWNATVYSGDSPSHLLGWSKNQSGLITPTDVTASFTAKTITPSNSNNDYLRIWLDKYRIGEHFFLENRQQTNYDAGLPSSGLLITHINPSNISNADEDNKLVDVEAADGLANMDANINRGDSGDIFPGSTNNTTFNGASTPNASLSDGSNSGVSVSSVSESGSNIITNIIPSTLGQADHIRYDLNGYIVPFGVPSTIIWTAVRFTNDTNYTQLEGFEVILNDTATVDVYFYNSIPSGTPTTLLNSELGLVGVSGTNRYLLSTNINFEINSDIVLVLKITNASYQYPAATDNTAPGSRSWISSNGSGAFGSMAGQGEFNQHLLIGIKEDNSFKVIKLQNNKVLVLP